MENHLCQQREGIIHLNLNSAWRLRPHKITKLSAKLLVATMCIQLWLTVGASSLKKKGQIFSSQRLLVLLPLRKSKKEGEKKQNCTSKLGDSKWNLSGLKKNLPNSIEKKRLIIDPAHAQISIRRQCELIGLNRATYYLKPAGESPYNLMLMELIDKQYMETPFYGYLKITAWLRRQNHLVNKKRVARLMQLMGLQAVFPGRKTTIPAKEHKIYPYLLRGVSITRPNQVWSTDITYIPMVKGFMYLAAVIDWYSRYVLSWTLSNTLDSAFCLEALEQALQRGTPEIFNTDQGAQFTAHAFTSRLTAVNIRISMDGRGRALDNIFVERLWRTVKYEDIYLKNYENVPALIVGLNRYFAFYNEDRLHQHLGYNTPKEVHFDY